MNFPRLAYVRRFAVSLSFMTTAAALWFAVPSDAQILVSAPSDAQARQMQAWYEHHVPRRFRAHSPILVREMDDAQMAAYLKGDDYNTDSAAGPVSHTDDGDGDIDGIFESDPDRIALRLSDTGTVDLFTFAHEYGHYVWFHLLSKDDRSRYEAVYDRQRAAHRLVTRYAATDLEEGFAEAFSFYACEPLMLSHRDQQSFQFLTQCAGQSRS